MLVYGDHQEEVSAPDFARTIVRDLNRLNSQQAGLAWHQACVTLFIDLASLVQGVADRECEHLGHDDLTPAQDALMKMLRILAASMDVSWRSGFEHRVPPDPATILGLADLSLPPSVTLKRCEGYAFYGLYPETYLDAARDLPSNCIVIGLRSIGTGLAALVAAAAGAETLFTLRPSGAPFSRSVQVGRRLTRFVQASAHQHFVIVDEGPGLSGSSFGGVADWLESLGVARSRIIFMPSHPGDLGPQAADEHRLRWAGADRRVLTFEQLFTSPTARVPLHSWFRDITGKLNEAPEDRSGGGWARDRAGVPTSPFREARKFLLEGSEGKFIAKFAGLDAAAQAKFGRAKALHEAGFCAEPLAMRYGFIIERYVDGAPTKEVPTSLLSDYCTFRTNRFPARQQGSTLRDLLRMAEYNIREAAPDIDHDFSGRWHEDRVAALQAVVEPVHIDGRLQWWEWLRADGRILKTDAVDHSQGHDLVGCQDILWDVAGATIELGAADDGGDDLASAFIAGSPRRRELLQLMKLCYLGFQLGWWSMCSTAQAWARRQYYCGKIEPLLATCA
jgi:hypothetical protein